MYRIFCEYLSRTSLKIQKHHSGFRITHSVKFCHVIYFLIFIVILGNDLILNGKTGCSLIDIFDHRNTTSVYLGLHTAPAYFRKCRVNINIRVIRSSSGIVWFQITGQIFRSRLVHTLFIKIIYKFYILICIYIRAGYDPGVIISGTIFRIQSDLQGIFLVH